MAYLNTTQTARGGLLARMALLKDGVATALQQRRMKPRRVLDLG